jgi:ribonuclease BN (tRNA processing enzyme)
VEVGGEPPLIIDLGTGLRALGDHLMTQQLESSAPLQANVLLSHLHYDHVLGLPFFAPMRDPGTVIDVYGPSQGAAGLENTLASMVRPPFFPIHMGEFQGTFRFTELEGSDEFAIGAVKVRVGAIPHIGRTLGFRLEADGRSLAPADLRTVEPEVLELCHDADLLLHDAQYTEEEFVNVSDWGHSTANYAVEVARQSGAKRLTLFHHDPAHSDETIDRMLLGAQELASRAPAIEVRAASEGSIEDLGQD